MPLSAVLVDDAEISRLLPEFSSKSAALLPELILFLSERSDAREFLADVFFLDVELSLILAVDFLTLQSLGTTTPFELPHPILEFRSTLYYKSPAPSCPRFKFWPNCEELYFN